MESSLNKLIEGFPANPVASGKFLQRLILDDPPQFFHALPLLRTAPTHRAGLLLCPALLHSQNLVLKNLCDPALFTKHESIALAKRLARVEPLFDMKLAKMLLSPETKSQSEAEQAAQGLAGLRLLEIMAEASGSWSQSVACATSAPSQSANSLQGRLAAGENQPRCQVGIAANERA